MGEVRRCKNPACRSILDKRHVSYCCKECKEIAFNKKTGITYHKQGVMVECKCPACGKNHEVPFSVRPKVKPRVFCVDHKHRRQISMSSEYAGF